MVDEEGIKEFINYCSNDKLKISILHIQRKIKLPFVKAKLLRNILLDKLIIDEDGYVIADREEIEKLDLK